MPLARYFAFVGGLLLALLFWTDWYFPKLAAPSATAGVDKTIIRLHSAHKWPEAIVFDTNTIPAHLATAETPPPPSTVADPAPPPPSATAAPSARQAFAMVHPAPAVASPNAAVKHVPKRRTRVARGVRSQSYQIVGFRDSAPWAAW
jgi:hypothetical protein